MSTFIGRSNNNSTTCISDKYTNYYDVHARNLHFGQTITQLSWYTHTNYHDIHTTTQPAFWTEARLLRWKRANSYMFETHNYYDALAWNLACRTDRKARTLHLRAAGRGWDKRGRRRGAAISLYLCLSIYLSLYIYTYIYIYMNTYVYICQPSLSQLSKFLI